MNQEVLLSYRLLFGYNSKSRELFHRKFNANALQGEDNPFLKQLIGPRKSKSIAVMPADYWPETVRDEGDTLIEQDVYNTSAEFVMFGSRLLDLQERCARRNPSRIEDMWRDRRDRQSWITFWAVLIIGSISLLLSLLQVILATIQVVEARQGI